MMVQQKDIIVLFAGLLFCASFCLDSSSASCFDPLGMQNYGIDNSQISVSSETTVEPEKYGKQSARLNYKYSWRAKDDPSDDEYLQIDLGQTKTVTGIGTQGDKEKLMWVSAYKIQYSADGESWEDFQSFKGNNDQSSSLTNKFPTPLNTRYIKIVPESWYVGVAMRIELYGCTPTCENQSVGLENGLITNSKITASSTMSSGTKASNGRLRFTGDNSWCASVGDSSPYLLIDMSLPHVLCAVATQGNSKADQMVTLYTIQTSLNGQTWTEYKEEGQIKIFHGNSDRDSISKYYFNNSPVGRYVRILPKAFIDAPCLRVEFYGVERASCNLAASGIGEPHHTIPNQRFTATSVLSDFYSEYNARLQNDHGWEPMTNCRSDYLQIDLGDPHVLCAVGLQPSGQSYRIDERTTSFKMSFSMDGQNWKFYPKEKEYPGNFHPDIYYPTVNISKNTFDEVQVAKIVRIYPVKYARYKVIRTELYGLKQTWKKQLGIERIGGRAKVTNEQITASSYLNSLHKATNVRLYGQNSWCAKTKNSYIQIDFGNTKQLVGVAMHGDRSESKWVTEFNLEYGYLTNELEITKNIPINAFGNKAVKVHWLASPVGARYVRIIPTKWFGKPCIRLDLHVNDRPPPATITNLYVAGGLTVNLGSSATIKCVATGDRAVNFKWHLDHNDVTEKSGSKNHSLGQPVGQFRVNFTSVADFTSKYKCQQIDSFHIKCKIDVLCQAERTGANGDRKGHLFEIIIDLTPPTTTQPPQTTTRRANITTNVTTSANITTTKPTEPTTISTTKPTTPTTIESTTMKRTAKPTTEPTIKPTTMLTEQPIISSAQTASVNLILLVSVLILILKMLQN